MCPQKTYRRTEFGKRFVIDSLSVPFTRPIMYHVTDRTIPEKLAKEADISLSEKLDKEADISLPEKLDKEADRTLPEKLNKEADRRRNTRVNFFFLGYPSLVHRFEKN